nr:7-cyano-7-deazaguanine synthase QueC [Woodsholea maritima]
MQDEKAALVLFSGGQDSATCLAWALSQFDRVETIGFDYGQRHDVELRARQAVRTAMIARFPDWAARLGPDLMVDITGFGALSDSAMIEARAIEMTEKGLPNTFVPGRNLVFLTVASAHAYRRGCYHLVGGMCQTDFSGYPDCREDTLQAQAEAIRLGLDEPFSLHTPLMHLTKGQTWQLAKDLGGDGLIELIREESHTCYLGDHDTHHEWGYGCGTCPACQLRAKGWNAWQKGEAA